MDTTAVLLASRSHDMPQCCLPIELLLPLPPASKQMKITSAFGAFLDPVADKIMCGGGAEVASVLHNCQWGRGRATRSSYGCWPINRCPADLHLNVNGCRRVSTALVLLATAPPVPISNFGMAVPVCLMIGR